MTRSLEKLKNGFLQFASTTEKDNEVLYAELCRIISDSEDCLKLADNVPLGQPYPNILLAAIQYLLLNGKPCELQHYFYNLTPEQYVRKPDAILKSIFLDFVKENYSELVSVCKTRRVQTNETGRCSLLLPGLNYISSLVNEPIILIEIGTSAGLLLNFDRYEYRYSHLTNPIGSIGSQTIIECETKGNHKPPLDQFPSISRRVGIDLNIINCQNNADSLWLQSLVWPNDHRRLMQLKNALEICRTRLSEVELVQGDGFANVITFLDKYKQGTNPICLFHSFAINQISTQDRDEYLTKLKNWSKEEKIPLFELSLAWLSREEPKYYLKIFQSGEITTIELAKIHHHGKWIEWLLND